MINTILDIEYENYCVGLLVQALIVKLFHLLSERSLMIAFLTVYITNQTVRKFLFTVMVSLATIFGPINDHHYNLV